MNNINSFTRYFTGERVPHTKIKNEFYLKDENLLEITREIDLPVFSMGLPLGQTKNNRFHPSLALLEHLSPKTDKNLLITSEKLEWLFLCGRDLFKKNVKLRSTGLLFVENEQHQNLGLCIANNGKTIRNIMDRGDFLRREN